jgi:phosphocarrier protein HPr
MPTTEGRLRFEVADSAGLHLRLAARFAGVASRFQAEVRVSHRDLVANGKSVIELLILAALRGARLELEARGPDAEQAVAALSELVAEWSREANQELTR